MSSIFGNKYDTMSGKLRNPNALRESMIFEYITNKGNDTIDKFVSSPEANIMKEEGMITDELIERLNDAKKENKNLQMTVLHMAKEDDDPMFAQLVALRAQEKEMMKELMDKYSEAAVEANKKYTQRFLSDEFPLEFK